MNTIPRSSSSFAMNFSFSGCGFLGIYHVGVSACLKKYAPDVISKAKFSGASAGSLAAVCLLCDAPLGMITSAVLKTVQDARTRLLGPFSPTFNVEKLLREGLFQVLPENAHELVSGRVSISVTRLSDGKNILLTHFKTREELIQALLCSAFIPGFSGWKPPTIKGVRYVDGGFTDNLPMIDTHTVTVSPFSGEADICPKGNNSGIITISLANTNIELSEENLYRFSFIVWPPPPDIMNKICQQGFNDTLDFLQRKYLLNCTKCLSIQSTFNLDDTKKPQMSQNFHDELNCTDCNNQRINANLDDLPDAVGSLLKEAIEQANISLTNWIFKDKSKKLLSILMLPYTLPKQVGYVLYSKIINLDPIDTRSYASIVIDLLNAVTRSWFKKSQDHHHHQKKHNNDQFSCQLNITEFTGEEKTTITTEHRQKFEFNMDMDNIDEVPTTYTNAMTMEADALSHLALRCAAKSLSKHASCVASRVASKNPSRAVSRAVSRIPSLENVNVPSPEWEDFSQNIRADDVSNILEVTREQDAVMAYYYMDENNEMKVTEIFDMTNSIEQEEQAEPAPLSEQFLQSDLDPFTMDFDGSESNVSEEEVYRTCLVSPSSSNESCSNSQSEPEVDQFYQ